MDENKKGYDDIISYIMSVIVVSFIVGVVCFLGGWYFLDYAYGLMIGGAAFGLTSVILIKDYE